MSIRTLSGEELLLAGTAACPGCGAILALRLALKALGRKTILIIPAGCVSVSQGMAPYTAVKVPVLNIAFAASAAAASGIVEGLDVTGVFGVTVAVWAGDGGTADIGIQALSGAAERQTDFIYFCCDNESYMNTGIQRSSSTPFGAWTTTTPTGKREPKKDMPFIMAAHNIPYIATACSSYPVDLVEKTEMAKGFRGTSYMNTGIQRSSSTPFGAWTTTTPTGKREPKKDMPFIMAAHKIPYIATACSSYPVDFVEKTEMAKGLRGTKYVQVLAPCPSGWRFPAEKTIEIGRLAVETGIWPLFTIKNRKFSLSLTSERLLEGSKRRPVREYFEAQGRFHHLSDADIDDIQHSVSTIWDHLGQINNEDLF